MSVSSVAALQLSFEIPDQPFVEDTYGLMPSKVRVKVCYTCRKELPMSEFRGKLHGRVRIKSNCRKCEVANTADWLSRNRERDRASKRKRYAMESDSMISHVMNNRAKRHGVTGKVTLAQLKEVKALYSNQCAYCGNSSLPLQIDHLWPLSLASKGLDISEFATNEIDNLLPSCAFCNRAKGDKPFIIMLAWKYGRLV